MAVYSLEKRQLFFVRYIIHLFCFNNKFLKINHDNNVMISQKINEVQIIIKPSKKKQGGLQNVCY